MSPNAAFFAAGGFVATLFLGGAAYAVTDTIFKYSTPKTGYYSLSPNAFGGDGFGNYGDHIIGWPDYLGTSAGGCFTTGVNLPQGAKLTALAAWTSSDAATGVRIHLHRVNLATGHSDEIVLLQSKDTTQTRTTNTFKIPASATATVDNQRFDYGVAVCLASANSRYLGGRITYSYDNAGD